MLVAGLRGVVRRSRPQQRLRLLSTLNKVTENDVSHFTKILPSSSVLSTLPPSAVPSSELDIYNNDWMGKYSGKATTVLKPKTTQQVSEIVKWCSENSIGIVPQGGNTGLVGGSVPINDEVVVSLSNMNTVRSFDPVSGEHLRFMGNRISSRVPA